MTAGDGQLGCGDGQQPQRRQGEGVSSGRSGVRSGVRAGGRSGGKFDGRSGGLLCLIKTATL